MSGNHVAALPGVMYDRAGSMAGMLFAAQRKWNIDLARSFMVGDTDNDTIAGSAAGCATILVDAEYNREVKSDFRAADFLEAARLVISQND